MQGAFITSARIGAAHVSPCAPPRCRWLLRGAQGETCWHLVQAALFPRVSRRFSGGPASERIGRSGASCANVCAVWACTTRSGILSFPRSRIMRSVSLTALTMKACLFIRMQPVIYAGKVQVLTQLGRMMIPKSEVERLLLDKQIYNGKPTRPAKRPSPSDTALGQEVASAG